MKHAKRGGETGVNGSFYTGGQFLPQREDSLPGARIKAGGKKEIAPYVWAAAPADDLLSIYDRIGQFCTDNRVECEFVKGQGFVGLRLTVLDIEPAGSEHIGNGYYKNLFRPVQDRERFAWLCRLAERFNAGERWFPLADDHYHYLNLKH